MFSVGLVGGVEGEFDWGDVHPNCLVFALGALIGGFNASFRDLLFIGGKTSLGPSYFTL
jgi:hypothetical protein